MAELAVADGSGIVSTRQLAESQDLSVKYLEHIMASLKAAGVVSPVRGMRGGYRLARASSAITLSEIYEALEGSAALVECVDAPEGCPVSETCPTRETWVELTSALTDVLSNTTVQDVVDRRASTKNLGARRRGGAPACAVKRRGRSRQGQTPRAPESDPKEAGP
jgi:Rrf2 family protein